MAANNFERGDGTFFAGGDDSAPIVDVKATTGTIVRLPRGPWVRITSAAALTSLTLKMPAAEPGDVVNIHFVNGIANFALRTFLNGAIVGAPTTILPKAVLKVKFFNAKLGWVVLNNATVATSVGTAVVGQGTGLDGSTSGSIVNSGTYDTTDPDEPISSFTGGPNDSTLAGELYFTVQADATAFPSGDNVTSTLITAQFCSVTNVATAGDGMLLPPANLGDIRYVANNSTNPFTLFANPDAFKVSSGAVASLTIPQYGKYMFVCMEAGFWETFQAAGPVATADSIVAHGGGGRPGSPMISANITRVTTVSAAGDSVTLPAALAGDYRVVLNSGAKSLQLFGNSSDTIGGIAGATGVPVPAGGRVTLYCITKGAWHAAFAMGNVNGTAFGVTNGVTAHSGGGRSSAVLITTTVTQVSVSAAPADSVVLPPALPGDMRVIINDGASSVQVFGDSSDTIDGVAGATGVVITTLKRAVFFCAVAGAWFSMAGAKTT